MSRIVLIGANGQLGTALSSLDWSGDELICLTRSELDLSDIPSIGSVLSAFQPDFIVNAAAFTAVDRAESEREISIQINTTAVAEIAKQARRLGSWLIHFSTDYVFEGGGDRPWAEVDPTNPVNSYGADKLSGEEAVANAGGRWLVLRTSWVFSASHPCFFTSMLRLTVERDSLGVVDDQWGAPTYSRDLAVATQQILSSLCHSDSDVKRGVYHVCGTGQATWYQFCVEIFKIAETDKHFRTKMKLFASDVKAIASEAYPLPAKRPANSILSQEKIVAAFNVHMPNWKDALGRCYAEHSCEREKG